MDEVPERYRYIGKERGEESGLYYCGAGYYAPWIMRWISPDPMDARDGMNLYGYASSNPVKHVDMTGFTTNNPSPNQRRATFKEGISQGKLIEGPIAEHLDYPEGVKEKDQGHVEAQKAAASTEKAAVQTEESAVQPEKALVQSERAATNPVKKLLQTAKESKIGETIEKVATKAAPAVKVLGHLAGALDTVETVESIVDDVQTLRHYDGWGEKAVAVLDIASNALILIPAPQTRAIGMGITMGVAAGRALYEFFKSPDPPPSPPVETMPADKPQAPEGFPCVCCTPLGKGCMTFAK
ncbi:MAG: hypothetical protein M1839_007134 [Geoglossum umbratile]|nr:MAG: hypothetical protein M1839_007134 [Geoglossum umbratile]